MGPYATVDDVAKRLGRDITDQKEIDQVTELIADVSALVDEYCTKGVPDPAPPVFKAVVCNEVISALNSKPGISSERVDVVEMTYSYSTGSGSISNLSKVALQRYRRRYWWGFVSTDQDVTSSAVQ